MGLALKMILKECTCVSVWYAVYYCSERCFIQDSSLSKLNGISYFTVFMPTFVVLLTTFTRCFKWVKLAVGIGIRIFKTIIMCYVTEFVKKKVIPPYK